MGRSMVALGALALAGCMTGQAAPPPRMATAELHGADGAAMGRATVSQMADGLLVRIDAKGLPPGTHGLHIHMVGRCDAPDFATAGGHWNPAARQHGSMNPMGPHEGDLPNLEVRPGGRGSASATLPGAALAALMDADGAAIVIHAGPDDLKTDPAGNSGARIACGVLG